MEKYQLEIRCFIIVQDVQTDVHMYTRFYVMGRIQADICGHIHIIMQILELVGIHIAVSVMHVEELLVRHTYIILIQSYLRV